MGMFDDVDFTCDCPACGTPVSGFQTKDWNCIMELVQPSQILNFYASCDACEVWIELNRVVEPVQQFEMIWRTSGAPFTDHLGSKVVSIETTQPNETDAEENP